MKRNKLIWLGLAILTLFLLISIIRYHKNQSGAVKESSWFGELNPISVNVGKMLGPVPGEVVTGQRGVKIQEGNGWQIYRLYPSGTLEVFYRTAQADYERLNLPLEWRRDTYPMLIIPAPDRLRIIGYDVVKNVASGRSLVASQRGFDLFEIDPKADRPLQVVASGIDLGGGIDSLVYARLVESTVSICVENTCADIDSRRNVRHWALSAISDYEFVEVAFDRDSAYAILRRKWDDRIHGPLDGAAAELLLARMSQSGVEVEPIRGAGVPFGLAIKNGKVSWRTAKTREQLQELFLYEVSRMRNRGLIDYGDNNLEGRLAWSQVYYLNGLITAGSSTFDLFTEDIKEKIRTRVKEETELIAGFAENDDPGYLSKRYSVQREPLLFVLHLGRVSQLLARSRDEGMASSGTSHALERIQAVMWAFEATVEHMRECDISAVGSTPCITLFYRAGQPFWADGANVPFNYISGYTLGLLSTTAAKQSLDRAHSLLQPFYNTEEIAKLPKTWRYWWGRGRDGWSRINSPSLNTPVWQGDAAGMDLAHITYRSIDAAALLLLHSRTGNTLTSQEVAHFRRLVEQGWLLPQVSEYLEGLGERVIFSEDVAKRNSRSAQAWQIQSQIWALRSVLAQQDSLR